HPLNMRAIAHKYAAEIGTPYNELTLIIAHLGGGITISLHRDGQMIDMISDEEGPFSPERAGGLPAFQTLKLACSSGKSSIST
ncbi:MAG: butyrate kinase, partial [Pseudoflavonifractor sp.]